MKTILDTIGNTPIVKLNSVANHIKSNIFVKLEFFNPGGSIKDRVGKYVLEKALKEGRIKKGSTIIEGTSGNTGIGLCLFAALHGMKTIFTTTDKQSQEKVDVLRAFGAEVIVCPTNVEPQDPRSYYSVAKKLSQEITDSYYVNQYDNPDNFGTHFNTTGPEIFAQMGNKIDVYLAGVGTGGTISGTGTFLKSKIPNLQVVGVDIEGSILAHYHQTGIIKEAHSYVLEGIGEDILPQNVHFNIIDKFVTVGDKESFLMTRRLLKEEGLYAGGSSGAAVVGALRYAETLTEPKNILVILPDSGNRYVAKIYNDKWMKEKGYIE
ncbi:MAG: cysteine synthase family protein [Bacteriovoracaceae bacterium]|nr:cysteine synthase family protein [Bacteriovoracaceae bacterium]